MKNKQALIKVAEWLEAGAPHTNVEGHNIGSFDMRHAIKGQGACGTACCIAGAIVQFENLVSPVKAFQAADFFDSTGNGYMADDGVGPIAADYLDISQAEAIALFEPWRLFDFETYDEFSDPYRAAQVVRNYLETGKVDWDAVP